MNESSTSRNVVADEVYRCCESHREAIAPGSATLGFWAKVVEKALRRPLPTIDAHFCERGRGSRAFLSARRHITTQVSTTRSYLREGRDDQPLNTQVLLVFAPKGRLCVDPPCPPRCGPGMRPLTGQHVGLSAQSYKLSQHTDADNLPHTEHDSSVLRLAGCWRSLVVGFGGTSLRWRQKSASPRGKTCVWSTTCGGWGWS